ncbi:alpha/beta fold hydrolase [Acidisoma sp. C75]
MPEIAVAGERLSYLKAAPKAGGAERTMLLVHGFAADARSWSLNQPALAEAGARVFAIDLPGHGLIPAEDGAGLDRLAAIVLAAAAELGEGRPVHLVGHSMGGAIVLAAAARAPAEVRALTLIAPAGLGSGFDRGFIQGLLAAEDAEGMRAALAPLVANPAILGRQIVEGVLAARRRPHTYAAWQAMAATAEEIWARRVEAEAALAALPMPAQILWGAADTVLAPPAAPLPGYASLHLFHGLGHVPHMEGLRQVMPLITGLDARSR